MEHLLFNCHGEATILMQSLASLPFIGAFLAPYLFWLRPTLGHDHDAEA